MSYPSIYNVRMAVVGLVPASSPEEAIRKLRNRIEELIEVDADYDGEAHAFESEDLGPEIEASIRTEWSRP